jgi:trehalose/maltose hydrolase-like predicted phosphorylase
MLPYGELGHSPDASSIGTFGSTRDMQKTSSVSIPRFYKLCDRGARSHRRRLADDDFFLRAGAEIVLDTARFWASRAVAEADGKRHIRHVIGPDEYHEDVDDNAFTNVMARWNIARGLDTIDVLREHWPNHATVLREKLALGDEELDDWRDAIARIVSGLDPATGIYEEFAGFQALQSLELGRLRRPQGAD